MNMFTLSPAKRSRKVGNWPLFALSCAAALTAEAITFRLLWEYEPDHLIGVLFSILTAAFALTGIVVSGVASRRKDDPRVGERRKAFAARVVSWLLILPSAFIGGGAMAQKMQDRAAIEYAGSAAYAGQLALSTDETAEDRLRQQASLDLERAIRPTQARMDDPAYFGSVIAFLAIMGLPLIAVGAGLSAKPETATERQRREASVRAAKAAVTREANRKAVQKVAGAARLWAVK